MRTLNDIRKELDRAVARRAELWHDLNDGVDPAKSAEAAQLSEQIEELCAETRPLRAYDRFGPSDAIRARARAEERLERDSRRLKAA
jgi:predicted phage-related endonuclease